MKTIAVRELQKKIKETVADAQKDRVVITRQGKPAAVMVGVEGQDWESVVLETDPAFWKLISKRRKETTISFQELKTRINGKN